MSSKICRSAFSVLSQAFPVPSKMDSDRTSVMALESGKIPLPIHLEEKLKAKQSRRGAHWTEEEHRQFLYGLKKCVKGDWVAISQYVPTRSSSQVASHAQKYFIRLSSTKKEGKRLSIHDVTTLEPEQLSALEKATTSCMLESGKEESSTAGTGELVRGDLERSAVHAGTQLLSGYAMGASCSNASGKRGRRKKASSADENKLMLGATKAPSNAGKLLLPRYPNEAPEDIGHQLLPEYPNQLGPSAGSLGITGHPTPSYGMVGCSTSAAMQGAFEIADGCPNQLPSSAGSLEITVHPSPSYRTVGRKTGAAVKDFDVLADCLFDVGSCTDVTDLDLSLFPHFLD